MMDDVFAYLFPSMMIMWLFFIASGAMLDVYVEQEQKTMRRLLASTVTPGQFLLAKIVRGVLLCFACEGILVAVTWSLFGLAWGNPFWLIVVLFFCNLCFTGVVALIAALSNTKGAADAISTLFIIMSSILGGGMMPFEESPPFMQAVGQYTINRVVSVGLHAVIGGEPLSDILRPCAYLAAVGGAAALIGVWRLKKRMEAGEV